MSLKVTNEGAPRCPKCGASMVRRRARTGAFAGQDFWGCSQFATTGCRGKRRIGDPSDAAYAAGASARAEHDRRYARHRERVLGRLPTLILISAFGVVAGLSLLSLGGSWGLFGIVLALLSVVWLAERVVRPLSVKSWAVGAEGEEATARYLADLESADFVVRHDLRIPRSRANIDHLVIGPTGVFVIDSKSIAGTVRQRGGELIVGGRRRTRMIDSVRRQAEIVEQALGPVLEDSHASVTPVLCIHRAEFPLFQHRFDFDGVAVTDGRRLVELVRSAPGMLPPEAVGTLTSVADARFRPYQ